MGKKPSKIEKIAYHEAGHAVACHLLWRAFTRVSIIPDDDSLGGVEYPKIRVKGLDFEKLDEDPVERFLIREKLEKRLERRKEKEILIRFSGVIAENKYCGRHNWRWASRDINTAIDLHEAGSDKETNAYLNWLWWRAVGMITNSYNWELVTAVANELFIKKELNCRNVKKIIKTITMAIYHCGKLLT